MKIISSLSQFLAIGLLVVAVESKAQLVGVSGSRLAPAATYGGYTMTGVGADAQPLYALVDSVAVAGGGEITFGTELLHLKTNPLWSNWGHGYTGDVYYNVGPFSLTLTLPSDTKAFYFYADPLLAANHKFVATAGNLTVKESINRRAGAELFAFYAEGDAFLSSITIRSDDLLGFGIGEFGISRSPAAESDEIVPVPEPSTYALAGAAALLGLAFVRRIRRRAA